MRNLRPAWFTKENVYSALFNDDTVLGRKVNIAIMIVISVSIFVTFIETVPELPHIVKLILEVLEALLMVFFTAEYVLRIWSHPQPRQYVLSFFGIVDLLAVLPPYLGVLFPNMRYMLLMRSLRFIRIFRIFRLFDFLNEGHIMIQSIVKSRRKITVYFCFVLTLVICLGTLMYMVENGQEGTRFTSLGSSIYWAIVTLTTVGYGDITPVTTFGRMLSAFVMILGYTIIAVPTGIVTASFIDTTKEKVKDGRCPRCGNKVGVNDKFCKHCGEKLWED